MPARTACRPVGAQRLAAEAASELELNLDIAGPITAKPMVVSSYSPPAAAFNPDGFYGGAYRVYMEVRPTEVDQFNVVNNTVYAEYLLFGRHKLMEGLGCSVEYLQEAHGILAATVKQSMTFKEPLRPGDRFYVSTGVTRVDSVRMTGDELIVRLPRRSGEKPTVVVEAQVTCLFLDKDYRPIRVPEDARAALKHMCDVYTRNKATAAVEACL